ncbi:hypothetical protein [Thermaurantiacus sp.]
MTARGPALERAWSRLKARQREGWRETRRQGYRHMRVSEVRLSNQGLIILGAKPDLERAGARAAETPGAPVPTSARTWRTREDSNL